MLKKIKELNVNSSVKELTLAVKSAEIKRTKKGSDFLSAELFDGTDTLRLVVWDWSCTRWMPKPNDVVDVTGSVSEWNGVKQITGSSVVKSTEVSISAFCPKGDFDVNEYYDKAMDLIAGIENEHLRKVTEDIYTGFKKLFLTIPAALSVHNAYLGGTLEHCVNVATLAKKIAQEYNADTDLVVAGGLLHDVGKLWTYSIDATVISTTLDAQLMGHISMGALIVDKYRTAKNNKVVKLLQHIILSHHGSLEYGSPVTPKFIEAFIVSQADMIDSKVGIYLNANKGVTDDVTPKVYFLNNQPVVSQQYVNKTVGNIPQE